MLCFLCTWIWLVVKHTIYLALSSVTILSLLIDSHLRFFPVCVNIDFDENVYLQDLNGQPWRTGYHIEICIFNVHFAANHFVCVHIHLSWGWHHLTSNRNKGSHYSDFSIWIMYLWISIMDTTNANPSFLYILHFFYLFICSFNNIYPPYGKFG